MIKFLDTEDTSFYLRKLINNANNQITLVSPFIKINQKLKNEISEASVDVKVIYGKTELHHNEINFLQECKNVSLLFCNDLHAKCYLSESECIISSMNLHEYSQNNNFEMSIYFTKKDNQKLYEDVQNHVDKIIKHSKKIKSSYNDFRNEKTIKKGYCIRTGIEIPFNIDKPFSYEAFLLWDVFQNEDYPEAYCHATGERSHGETSYAYPILKKNWKKAMN